MPAATQRQTESRSHQEPLDRYSVNMTHLALFNNLSSKEFLSLEEFLHSDVIETELYIKYALTTPYLMHQLLATSAFHLSIISTELNLFYRDHATGLQTRALSLFNEGNQILEVTSANCVQTFLFSTLLGVHLLCDALQYQRDSLDGFIRRFTYCLSVHCGVLAIVKESSHFLHETEVGPRLTPSHVWEQPPPTIDPECEALRDLVDATNVPLSSQQAYQEAILRLQQVFQAQRDTLQTKLRLPLAFAWPAMLSPNYIELLRQQQAEALIILAHYAVLLHRGRHLWMFGDGGRFLIEIICGSLGPQWQKYLKVPMAVLQEP